VLKLQWWKVIFETETGKECTQVNSVTATFESFVADEYWERTIKETKLLQAYTWICLQKSTQNTIIVWVSNTEPSKSFQ